jgi:HK97 family phage major capsid protein
MNWRIQRLKERQAQLVKQSDSILETSAKEDREPTEAEQTTLSANKAELETILAKVKREDDLAAFAVNPATTTDSLVDTGGSVFGKVKAAFEKDPNKGFATPSEFFASVMDATIRGKTEDDRLRFLATAGSDEHGTYADPYGGFLVPAGFSPNMLSVQAETDPTAGRTTAVSMSAPQVSWPARTDKTHTSSVSGGLRVYRRAESQTVSSSRMATELVTLTATELMGLTYATDKILRESPISIVSLLQAGFRDEFGAKVLYEKIHGTGAGQMEGILNAPCTVSVDKEDTQDAKSIAYENIIKMRSQCWGYQNAVWLYNHDCLPQLMQLVMVIGTSGVPMWQNSAREGEPDLLLGRPAFPTEFCATVGSVGDIILGNWSQYLEGTRRGVEMAESMHVRFEYAEQAFRFLMENDGRCWWRSALTPKKSSTTLSPFVTLAARA